MLWACADAMHDEVQNTNHFLYIAFNLPDATITPKDQPASNRQHIFVLWPAFLGNDAMRIMRRKAIGVAISTVSLLATTSALTLLAPGTADAATYDYQWPDETGCSNTAVTVHTASQATGLLELRYSTACRTVWARLTVHRNALIKDPQAWVVRNSDGRNNGGIVKISFPADGSVVVFSEMLNDAGVTSYAAGDWTTIEGHHTARTASY